jgi:arabinogalactan endo-1,4-beta-galactosidase
MTENTTNQTEKIKTYRKLTRIHEQYNKPVLVQERKLAYTTGNNTHVREINLKKHTIYLSYKKKTQHTLVKLKRNLIKLRHVIFSLFN